MLKFFLVKEVPKINSLKETPHWCLIDGCETLMCSINFCKSGKYPGTSLGGRQTKTITGIFHFPSIMVRKPGCYWCRSMPYISVNFFGAPAAFRTKMEQKKPRRFLWKICQGETLKESCLNMLHESVFFCFKTISYKFSAKTIWPPRIRSHSEFPGVSMLLPPAWRRVVNMGWKKNRQRQRGFLCLAHLWQIIPKVRFLICCQTLRESVLL